MASDRQRRYRRRQRHGEAVARVVVNDSTLLALVQAERLSPDETLDRARIDQELTALIAEWADRWRIK